MSGSRTISGIALSNATLSSTAGAGTEVGLITVTMSDGSAFDGTLALSGQYASYFTVTRTRDPYSIIALNLDNYTLGANPAVGTKVGTLSVILSDGSVFAGTFAVNDTAHFRISGSDLVTSATVTSGQTYPITLTASDPGSTNQSLSRTFQISVQAALAVPGPLTSITSPSQDTSSITVAWAPPTTGGVCDVGVHQIQYKAAADSAWLNAPTVRYCTPGHGSFTDAYNNTWSLNSNGDPVINTTVDANSNATILYLVGGTVWQRDAGSAWWGTTPTGTVNVVPTWTAGGASPLQLTLIGLANGTTYNVRGYASNSAGNGTTSTAVNFATQAVQPSGGVGPAASSSFITVEFNNAFNYPRGTGQQIVSPMAWGQMSSSWTDHIGEGGDYFANNSYMSAFGQCNPGLLIHKAPGRMFNDDLSINTGALANMMNNTYKWFPSGLGGVVIATPGFSAQNWRTLSSSQYAQLQYDVANYFSKYTMANGQKFPLIGLSGEDESGMDNATMQSYYNAWIPRMKSVSNNLLAFGPTNSTPDPKDFANGVSGLDVFCGNAFVNISGGPDDMSALNQWPATETWTGVSGNNLKYMGHSSGGSTWTCAQDATGSQQGSYPEALMHCKAMLNNLNNARVGTICCFWGGIDDCGLMNYNPTIYPIGYYFGRSMRTMPGPRWQVPTNSTGMWTLATTPTSTRFGLLVFNVGNGSKSGTVALSHWPVNSTGNGSVSMWQMSRTQNAPGKDGAYSTVQATNGVTSSITFPDPSITILSV